MGERTGVQETLFYGFSLEQHVPDNHLLRSIDRLMDLSGIREHLRPFYSTMGCPSIDPELLIRMLLIGYCMGIRSERRLCEEVHLNLAYRWFCHLGLEGAVPDHSTFSKNRHGRLLYLDSPRLVAARKKKWREISNLIEEYRLACPDTYEACTLQDHQRVERLIGKLSEAAGPKAAYAATARACFRVNDLSEFIGAVEEAAAA